MKKVIIIGAGLAGSYLATQLPQNYDITIITKASAQDSNSMLAQGGIAASLDPGDNPASHEADTLAAGQHRNKVAAVDQLVHEGPKLIQTLIKQGMPFDHQANGALDFGLEGAHSHHRILHAKGDRTGLALTTFVQSQIEHVHWQENTTAVELLVKNGTCYGVRVRHDPTGTFKTLTADAVVLATGGLGNLFPLTTNDATITGDGIAIAARAGAKMADMAFMQFHPTLLSLHGKCFGLISEAVRGAGAILVDENNTPIMAAVPKKDLAPRDVVARHLTWWRAAGHQTFLDISAIPDFPKRFPGITANLDRHHVPFRTTNRIPIQPGAHFMMGGVQADLAAQTSIKRLFAIGEVACNGVHGANRLASNSLLDCLVSAEEATKVIAALEPAVTPALPQDPTTIVPPKLPSLADLRQAAWHNLGVERTKAQLHDFHTWLAQFNYRDLVPTQLSPKDFTIANLCLCAELIDTAALKEPKSIGAHYIKEVAHESTAS
ncbi:L-aspartate oxidase [Agrilactobacillus composti DSM 18527 = JCM 14202]|uniref:L-aspartate oxidase n=1 Tax=Agrilactobacillus composti DSM 18527 = JCM 14202 TaxID=1423734 RepID=A0A0R1XUZ4_9LACO|nr:L-aspartate oxidase [Agrilactobacillus composti]KRM30563.1 L-aspartate oxidase [Agrilactobacillus composti DSM 18527 = JCM 14202]